MCRMRCGRGCRGDRAGRTGVRDPRLIGAASRPSWRGRRGRRGQSGSGGWLPSPVAQCAAQFQRLRKQQKREMKGDRKKKNTKQNQVKGESAAAGVAAADCAEWWWWWAGSWSGGRSGRLIGTLRVSPHTGIPQANSGTGIPQLSRPSLALHFVTSRRCRSPPAVCPPSAVIRSRAPSARRHPGCRWRRGRACGGACGGARGSAAL